MVIGRNGRTFHNNILRICLHISKIITTFVIASLEGGNIN